MIFFLIICIHTLIIFLPILLIVAFFTLLERKLMALAQRRHGPQIVGIYGLLQAIADGVKLFTKEIIIPQNSTSFLFLLGPIFLLIFSILSWIFIPFYLTGTLCSVHFSLFSIYIISGLCIYTILLSGWSSNSKYSILGALRSTAQMISYELIMGFIFLILSLISHSFNILTINQTQQWSSNILPLLPVFFLFLIVILAETNRHPFDLPEAEAELVAGYNTEYSSATFAFFFLGEYANMFLMSCLTIIFFFGNCASSLIFSIKVISIMCFFIWARILLPRYRYDQLMNIGWKIFLPLIFSLFVWYALILKILNLKLIQINMLNFLFF